MHKKKGTRYIFRLHLKTNTMDTCISFMGYIWFDTPLHCTSGK